MPKKVIFDQKNVLVAGGAGFIGSHLCDELIKNAKVICIDDFSSGNEKNIDHLLSEPNFEFIRHDITEPLDLKKMPELQKFKIEFQGVQEIYNLACPMSPNNFEDNKIKVILANSYGVKNLLDSAKEFKAKFLHVSSSVVYGTGKDDKKIPEEYVGQVDMLSDQCAYDEGKRFAESLVHSYAEKNGIDARIMRLFRVYGPRMPIDDGHMIPDFINNALDGKDLVIYGDKDFRSSFCYISDCIDAIIKLMHSDIAAPVNIGSDVLVNLTDVAEKIIKIIGKDVKIEYKDRFVFMRPLCIPDIARARNELAWMPVMSLDKGLEDTIYELRASKGLVGVEQAL